MKITKEQLRKIIKEELGNKPALKEADSQKSIIDLYGYTGIKTKYDDSIVQRYGQKVVDEAIKNAPKYLAFMKEVKKLGENPLAKDFGKIASANASYYGSHIKGNVHDGIAYILDRFILK